MISNETIHEAGIHFASEPVTIDRHEWRVVVFDSAFGGRSFKYQFRPIGELPIWTDHGRWPGFDFTSRTMGLPVSLARLYEANKAELAVALEPAQSQKVA